MIEERGEVFPSLELDPDGDGLVSLAGIHRQVRGSAPSVGMSPSVTDAGWIGRAGIPTLIYGPGELANAHAVDESADMRELVDYAKIMIAFIADWCNRMKPEFEEEEIATMKGRETH